MKKIEINVQMKINQSIYMKQENGVEGGDKENPYIPPETIPPTLKQKIRQRERMNHSNNDTNHKKTNPNRLRNSKNFLSD
jgi:hypothetical protein